jgi:BlaI family penicillinase repressor
VRCPTAKPPEKSASNPPEKLPQISDAEWEVMKAVWDGADASGGVGLTAGEVVDAVGRVQDWHPRTIKTLLNRLVQKKAVDVRVDGRRYLYRPRVPRDAALRRESRSFLSRVFGGAVAPAVVHLLEQSDLKLTPQEIEQLRAILESGEERDKGTRRQGDKGTG